LPARHLTIVRPFTARHLRIACGAKVLLRAHNLGLRDRQQSRLRTKVRAAATNKQAAHPAERTHK
jgi:hypothetical protein